MIRISLLDRTGRRFRTVELVPPAARRPPSNPAATTRRDCDREHAHRAQMAQAQVVDSVGDKLQKKKPRMDAERQGRTPRNTAFRQRCAPQCFPKSEDDAMNADDRGKAQQSFPNGWRRRRPRAGFAKGPPSIGQGVRPRRDRTSCRRKLPVNRRRRVLCPRTSLMERGICGGGIGRGAEGPGPSTGTTTTAKYRGDAKRFFVVMGDIVLFVCGLLARRAEGGRRRITRRPATAVGTEFGERDLRNVAVHKLLQRAAVGGSTGERPRRGAGEKIPDD